MGIRFFQEPELQKPDLIACWPGIANIGVIAIDTLREQMQAESLGEIEPWDFFYPSRVVIESGMLKELDFPGSRFYYKRLEKRDLIFFLGEEQPTDGGKRYAEGTKAYQMANFVLDAAERFGCQRVYTSGAAVAFTHHQLKPRVWAVTSSDDLNREVKGWQNTVLMGEIEGRGGQGTITGLNGLLLGMAKKRGLDAICLMGEIPDYLSGAPFPYPKASQSVLEVLTSLLDIEIDYSALNEMTAQIDQLIDSIYQRFPPNIRERLEQRKSLVQPGTEAITEEDEKWIKEHIDEFFNMGGKEDDRAA